MFLHLSDWTVTIQMLAGPNARTLPGVSPPSTKKHLAEHWSSHLVFDKPMKGSPSCRTIVASVFSRSSLFSILFAFVSGCKSSPPSAPVDTPPTVSITSPNNGETCRLVDTVYISASDDKAVTKVELYVSGSKVGTAESEPWGFIWPTESWNDGTCTLYAIAYDAANHSTTSQSVTVTISNAFPVKFYNTTYTTMSVTAGGQGMSSVTGTVLADDSVTLTLPTNPRTLSYSATTNGKTTNGTVIGVTLNWSGSGNVSSFVAAKVSVAVPSTYFFLYLRNSGTFTWYPIRVNAGLSDQTTDYISIPNDGNAYRTGYYKAHNGAYVRAYNGSTSSSYIQWTLSGFTSDENQAWLLTLLSR